MNLNKIGKVFTSKSVGTGPSSYEKKNLPGRGLTEVEKHWSNSYKTHVSFKHNNLLHKIILTAVSIILCNKLLCLNETCVLYE